DGAADPRRRATAAPPAKGAPPPCLPSNRRSAVLLAFLELEPDLHLRLELADLAAGDVRALLADLQPLQVADRLARPPHRLPHRVVEALLRRAHQLDRLVRAA